MIRLVELKDHKLFEDTDCIVLKRRDKVVTIALPFHEDTPNLHLSISEALDLRNRIDELLQVKLLGGK